MEVKTFQVFLLLCLGFVVESQREPSCLPNPSTFSVNEGQTGQLCLQCNRPVTGTVNVDVSCSGPGGTTTDAPAFSTVSVTGRSGCADLTPVVDTDCNEGTETLTCRAFATTGVQLTGTWTVTVTECPCGQSWQTGNGATCEDPNPTAPVGEGCFFACPAGQVYSTTKKQCFAPQNCPKGSGTCNGDPHYTTFDGLYYDYFPTGELTVAEDCQDRSWSVCQVTSNRCSGGGAPTCTDESVFRVKRLGTTVRYNRFSNTFWFEGNTPSREDMAVTLSGSFFTAYLPQEDVTVRQYVYQLTVTVGVRWFGKVCGLYGTWDGNSNNEFSLRDGTVVGLGDPRFRAEFSCLPLPPPPPPPPPPCEPGPRKAAAEAFCSVMYNTAGSYASCHATLPPGNTYEEPVDTPYEQCVYDHCVVDDADDRVESACSNVLNYAEACRKAGFNVGDPPEVCKPTCPAGKIYKACGQLVPPSCDAPDGVDGCSEGCFCPDGQFLARNGECVTTCPCPIYFEYNNYYTEEKNGGFCVKLTRGGDLSVPCTGTMKLSQQLSSDASGTPGNCCGCAKTPVMCGGATECPLSFPANEEESCLWVKVDQDDTSDGDREATLTTLDGRTSVTIKNSVTGNCLSFENGRCGFIRNGKQVTPTRLTLAEEPDNDVCITVTTEDGSAKECEDYQGGKFKACFSNGTTKTNVLVPAVRNKKDGYRCFTQTLEACEGDPDIPMCSYKYGLFFIARKSKDVPTNGARKQKCFDRDATSAEVCGKKNTEVVLVTMLEEVKPDECFLGYNVVVTKVFKGSLSAFDKNSVWVLPVKKCSEPAFEYGKSYLVAGYLDEGVLVVEQEGFVLDCTAYTDFLDELCP